MDRFKVKSKMHRFRAVLLVASCLPAVLLLCGAGAGPALADSPPNARYAIRDPKVDSRLSPAARARAQRAAAIKKKQDLTRYIQSVMESQQRDATAKGNGGGR
jgi:hypothetical protein